MTTAVDLLEAVRDALGDPERWMKGGFFEKYAQTETATRCCVLGGLLVARNALGGEGLGAELALEAVVRRHPCKGASVASFNDAPETTHADVLALLDEAIEEARRRG